MEPEPRVQGPATEMERGKSEGTEELEGTERARAEEVAQERAKEAVLCHLRLTDVKFMVTGALFKNFCTCEFLNFQRILYFLHFSYFLNTFYSKLFYFLYFFECIQNLLYF